MTRTADDYIADNRRRIRNIDGRFIQVDSERSRDVSFGNSTVNVSVTATPSVRSTGTQVVFGHPSASKGFGRGTFGDDRGEYTSYGSAEASSDWTKGGRRAVAEALDGQVGAVSDGKAGGDTTAASPNDTALGSSFASTSVFASQNSNIVNTTANHDATDVVGTPGEYGLFDEDDALLARVTVDPSAYSVAATDEVRVVFELTFDGVGNGSTVITNDGEDAIAASIVSPKVTIGPEEFAFGSGLTGFTESDSSLTSEEFRVNCARDTGRDRITAFTRVPADELDAIAGSVNEISEIGLFDNDGRMIWAATFRPIDVKPAGENDALFADASFVVN